jgi:hypothetical protein
MRVGRGTRPAGGVQGKTHDLQLGGAGRFGFPPRSAKWPRLRLGGICAREVCVEVTENDYGKGRLVIFGALDADGANPTLVAVTPLDLDWAGGSEGLDDFLEYSF